MRISYPVACVLARIAEREALRLNVPLAIAVSDVEGGLLFFGRMDGALPASTEISMSKAYTAAALRMGTHDAGRLAQPGEPLFGIQNTHGGRIILFGGGLPLHLKGGIAGGIGISGGSVQQDMEVAQSVTFALEQMETLADALGDHLQPVQGNIALPALVVRTREALLKDPSSDIDGDHVDLIAGALALLWSDSH